ncbi:MAG: bifunctional adenosylcobinamide kinase/adenosylcobinamide-phosphate guanylyltransferase [Chloroflexi bacterium]|nr:MAG: bifunctional adenosylcobinamide kinase/adenosylcobinamide-phosphate guanylyltransferase [Chloroflexota bacterium]
MSASKLILILGGARSGKSDYAEKLAAELGGSGVLYAATAEIKDEEMARRIEAHRRARPAHWRTVEAPRRVAAALSAVGDLPPVVLLDCLTLLVSNIILALEGEPQETVEAAVSAEIDELVALARDRQVTLIVVSNEVGLGLVPPYPLGRLYRDVLGRANQKLAAQADRVVFMVAGLPLVVKGDKDAE